MENKQWRSIKKCVMASAGLALLMSVSPALAHEDEDIEAAGHEAQVLHLAGGHPVTLGAGVTMVVQGVDGGAADRGGTTYSVDIAFETEVAESGTAFIYLNSAQGTSANVGSEAGVNADDEAGTLADGGYSETRIAEAWLNFPIGEIAAVTVGKIDPTGIYDGNEVANDEAGQFLNDNLVNNMAIAFPGYAGGISLALNLVDSVAVNVGVFENADDFDGGFNSSFSIGEVALSADLGSMPGNLRLIGWSAPGASGTADNSGFAINADLGVTDTVTLFGRYGTQDDTNPFDSAISLGGQAAIGEGMLGAGYALLSATGTGTDDESVVELYYSYPLTDNVAITGDLQFVQGAGFDPTADDATVFGTRVQVDL